MRASAWASTTAPRRACRSCAGGWASSDTTSTTTAKPSSWAQRGSRCIRPATCWVRRRYGWRWMARSGSLRATTSASPIPTCAPFEVVPCDTFITEATFGLPVYRWPHTPDVAREIVAWRARLRRARRGGDPVTAMRWARRSACWPNCCPSTTSPRCCMAPSPPAWRCTGNRASRMLETRLVADEEKGADFAGELVMAPPSAAGSPWIRRFKRAQQGFASGWMRIRGNRRRRNYDRGFVVSDHADWPDLFRTVKRNRRAPRDRHAWQHRRHHPRAAGARHRRRSVPHRLTAARSESDPHEAIRRRSTANSTAAPPRSTSAPRWSRYFRDAPPARCRLGLWLLAGGKLGAHRQHARTARMDRAGKRAARHGWWTTATTTSAISPKR